MNAHIMILVWRVARLSADQFHPLMIVSLDALKLVPAEVQKIHPETQQKRSVASFWTA